MAAALSTFEDHAVISLHPAREAIAKAFGIPRPDLEEAAVDRWVIAPAETRHVPAARFLAGQLDRVRAVDFGTLNEVRTSLIGNFEAREPATVGLRLRDVDLVDGVLYGARSARHLRQRRRRTATYRRPRAVTNGALYESWVGNRWFGNWLIDDCLTYRLAEQHGVPVTTAPISSGHTAEYEQLLDIAPSRLNDVHFDELILFQDQGHNGGKEERATQQRRRALRDVQVVEHPGVFLLRGDHGQRRILRDEQSIAERLCRDRGFRIVDPMRSSVRALIEACAGAKVIAGIEGSHLVHGLAMMPRGAVLFVIQPPDRVLSVLKMTTDRQRQVFAFVVGTGSVDGFTVNYDEIELTLDLALA